MIFQTQKVKKKKTIIAKASQHNKDSYFCYNNSLFKYKTIVILMKKNHMVRGFIFILSNMSIGLGFVTIR